MNSYTIFFTISTNSNLVQTIPKVSYQPETAFQRIDRFRRILPFLLINTYAKLSRTSSKIMPMNAADSADRGFDLFN